MLIEWACVLCGCHMQNDWVSRATICIKFCIKLEHSSVEAETIWMIQSATAMRSWWLATSSWQGACSCILAHASFWQNIKSPRWLRPPIAQIWHPETSGFSQNQNHLRKGGDFRPSMKFRKIQRGSWWQLGELCEVPRCLLWRGLRCHCPMYNVSCIFFEKCLYFSYYSGWIPSG